MLNNGSNNIIIVNERGHSTVIIAQLIVYYNEGAAVSITAVRIPIAHKAQDARSTLYNVIIRAICTRYFYRH